jgi:putative inorganic carbon (HCO3(-)) transporter
MNSPHRDSISKFPLAAKYLMVLGLGVSIGLLILFLADREARWIILAAAALVGLVFIAVTPGKQRLLTTLFILSLQVDVYLRFLYGRAGSNEGLAIPLVVFAAVGLLLWYANARQLRKFRWAGSMGLPILALFATAVLALATSSERFVGLTSLWYSLQLYFLYWLAFNLVQSREDFERIIKLLLFTLAAQSIIYFIQSALGITFNFMGETIQGGDVPRPGGTVSTNPAGFTSFIMPALMITSALVISKARLLPRPHMLILMALGTGAIGLSFTRAAWIGFAMGLATIILFGWRRRTIQGRMVFWIAAITVVSVAILLPTMLTRVSGDYAALGGDANKATLDERLGLIRIALNIIAEHPLTGIGPGAYSQVFRGYANGADQWLFTVHNEFLLRAAENGIPGALAFVALLVVGFRVAFRLSKTQPSLISVSALGWCGALIALIWQMNWVPWIGWSYNAMLWLMLGLMDGAQRLAAPQEIRSRLRSARLVHYRRPRGA